MPAFHFERALFVVGEPDSGKSTQLRSMFRDVRLGNGGVIPTAHKLTEVYRLSNERCLYLRITSPHEAKESLDPPRTADDPPSFLDKTEDKINLSLGGRWNFASPLQPGARNYMPDVVDTTRAFVARFNPERTRVAFLNPDRHGQYRQEAIQTALVDSLRTIPSVEICFVDARDREGNGLFLADFFDFT
jgi:hypothetical protein